jgi:hypothetical protein
MALFWDAFMRATAYSFEVRRYEARTYRQAVAASELYRAALNFALLGRRRKTCKTLCGPSAR